MLEHDRISQTKVAFVFRPRRRINAKYNYYAGDVFWFGADYFSKPTEGPQVNEAIHPPKAQSTIKVLFINTMQASPALMCFYQPAKNMSFTCIPSPTKVALEKPTGKSSERPAG